MKFLLLLLLVSAQANAVKFVDDAGMNLAIAAALKCDQSEYVQEKTDNAGAWVNQFFGFKFGDGYAVVRNRSVTVYSCPPYKVRYSFSMPTRNSAPAVPLGFEIELDGFHAGPLSAAMCAYDADGCGPMSPVVFTVVP